jgi:hypothetical protein
MIRKMLFIAGAITMIALITVGLTFGLPAKSTTSAAVTPSAVQSCNFAITVTDLVVGPRKPLGGRDVTVTWAAPANLPNCVKVKSYKVIAKIKFPNTFHDNQVSVAGSATSVKIAVPGFPTNSDPIEVIGTVTAVLETIATASGSKSEPIGITN